VTLGIAAASLDLRERGRDNMIVYARKEGTVIWSDNNKSHKAGRVPIYTPLLILKESGGCYKIERPENISLPFDPNYPSCWVATGDCVSAFTEDAPPDPDPEDDECITEIEVAVALTVVLKWLKQQ